MVKEFEGLKKRNLCKEAKKTFYKNGEFTTCVISFYIPCNLLSWNKELQELVERKFPHVRCYWTEDAGGCCPWCSVVATCAPSRGDVYSEKMGETISYSKAQKKMYSITCRVLGLASKWAEEKAYELEKGSSFMALAWDREQRFIDSL